MKEKLTLLIPLKYNDGTTVDRAVIQEIYDDLFVLCKGWTIEGEVTGAYQMETGAKKVERSVKISVVLERSDVPELKRLVQEIALLLGQECIYFERMPSTIEFIRAKQKRGKSAQDRPHKK